MEKETWKLHPDFRDYEFSNHGNFRKAITRKIMKNTISYGYVITFLYSYSKQKRVRVKIHRIIAELFLEKSQDPNKTHVNHIDGVKNNNHFTNLEWTTNQDNIQHSIDTGLRKRSPRQKLNEDDVRECRRLFDETDITIKELSNIYNTNSTSMKLVLKYKSWFNVDPDKKYEYKINQKNNQEFLKSKIKPIIYKKKQIPQDLSNQILFDYVNTPINLGELIKKYKICDTTLKRILDENQLPKPTLQDNEYILEISENILITNLGKLFVNGTYQKIKTITLNGKRKKIKTLIAEKFIPNPNNYDSIRHIDGNKENLALDNLEWYTQKIPDLEKNLLIDKLKKEYLESNITKKSLAKLHNISLISINRYLKGIKSTKPVSEKKYYIKKGKRPHLCKNCGDSNPDNFRPKNKGRCKTCSNKLRKSKYIPKKFQKKIF